VANGKSVGQAGQAPNERMEDVAPALDLEREWRWNGAFYHVLEHFWQREGWSGALDADGMPVGSISHLNQCLRPESLEVGMKHCADALWTGPLRAVWTTELSKSMGLGEHLPTSAYSGAGCYGRYGNIDAHFG
jgi:hypothetical protein